MRRHMLLASLIVLTFSARLPAQESLITQLPSGTVLALQVRGLERTQGRLVAMVEQMGEGFGQKVAAALDQGKATIFQGRELRGVAPDGRIVLALSQFSVEQDALTKGALLVETADYKELRDSFGGTAEAGAEGIDVVKRDEVTLYFAKRGKFTVISGDRQVASTVSKQKGPSSAAYAKSIAAAFEQGDVGLFVDMAAVNREFGPAIEQFREQFGGMFEAAAALQPGGDPEAMKAQIEAAKKMFNAVLTFVSDARALVAKGTFEKPGLAFSLVAEVKPQSDSSKFLAKMKPSKMSHLADLPDGDQMYVEFSGSPELFQALGEFGSGLFQQAGIGGEVFEKQMKDIQAAGPRGGATAMSMGKGISGVAIQGFDKPALALKATLAASEAMAKSKPPSPIKEVKIDRDALEHRGIKFSKIAMKYDLQGMAGQPGGELAAAQLRAFIGEEMVQWVGVHQNSLLQVTAPTPEAARARVDAALSKQRTIAHNDRAAEAIKQLPAESSLLLLMDLPSLIGAVIQQFAGAAGAIPQFQLPAAKPTYLGIAVVARTSELELSFWVPAEVVKQFIQLFQGLGGGIGPGQ